jgi:hypothetical protein
MKKIFFPILTSTTSPPRRTNFGIVPKNGHTEEEIRKIIEGTNLESCDDTSALARLKTALRNMAEFYEPEEIDKSGNGDD